jgi:hypothetical protein
MRKPKGVKCHDCAPQGWRGHTPNITGDYDLDETILHRSNTDMPTRFRMYVRKEIGPYTLQNGYNAYRTDID